MTAARDAAPRSSWLGASAAWLGACLLATGCAPSPQSSATQAEAPPMQSSNAEDEAAIVEFNRQYLAAINEGDVDALASLTADDHVMIPSGQEPLVGRDALVAVMTAAFERFEIEESWTVEETVVSGDLAYQRGTFVVVTTPRADGDPLRVTGNFLRIYRRQPDGAWLMVRDMLNSD